MKIAPKFQHCEALARVPKQMRPNVDMIWKALVTIHKMVYKPCLLHAQARRYGMSKLAYNREIWYFQTAVLAEPSDQNS